MAKKARFLDPLSNVKEDARRRALDALALARREPSLSLTKAAELSGTTIKTIRRYASEALEERGGRVRVKPTDRLKREMLWLTSSGDVTVTALDSETASLIAAYRNALRSYARTGDFEPVESFDGRSVDVEEGTFEFLTHRPSLDKLARAGELHFQDLYASTGGP